MNSNWAYEIKKIIAPNSMIFCGFIIHWRKIKLQHTECMLSLTQDKKKYVLTNPSAWARCGTRSILKWSLTGLNLDFYLSNTGCLTKAEEPSLPYYLPIDEGWIIEFIYFPRVLTLNMWKANNLIQDLNSSRRVPFLTTITITLWIPQEKKDT